MATHVINPLDPSTAPGSALDMVLSRRMAFVTGKGGVGKSTVAAALAMAAVARGRRATVCELGGRGAACRAPAVHAMSIDPDAALAEWMTRNIGRRRAALLTHSDAFRYFVAAAPGARELVTIGKAWDLTRPRQGRPKNRLVVVDAPASGHAIALLQAPATFSRLDRVGPIGEQAGEIREFLADPSRSAIVLVCTPAELPVAETLQLAVGVEEATGRSPDLVIANEVLPDGFNEDEIKRIEAARATSEDSCVQAAALHALTSWHRAREQESHLDRLRASLAVPVLELPFLFVSALGPQELRALAAGLCRQAAVPWGTTAE
jgi:anion-transporting  ArsA/GET3 family ATPase